VVGVEDEKGASLKLVEEDCTRSTGLPAERAPEADKVGADAVDFGE
jgi:hypothetical protein